MKELQKHSRAKQYAINCDEIIAAGGDGTLNEVINGIAKRVDDVRIGLIPLGTGNDFARSLNVSATLEENIDIVLSGGTTAIDVVRAKSDRIRYFVCPAEFTHTGTVTRTTSVRTRLPSLLFD
jgi:diacylglycerol kinase family enzyme